MNARLSVLKRQTLIDKCRTQQVGKPNTGRTSAEEQILFILQFGALQLGSVDHSGKRYASGALHVVVVDAVLIAITPEEVHRVNARPVLKVNAALREHLLNRPHKFIDEGIELLG